MNMLSEKRINNWYGKTFCLSLIPWCNCLSKEWERISWLIKDVKENIYHTVCNKWSDRNRKSKWWRNELRKGHSKKAEGKIKRNKGSMRSWYLTVNKREMTLPSEPLSLMADRSPSKKLLCLDVSTLWMGMSATWRARRDRVDRWDPTAPTNSMFPLERE